MKDIECLFRDKVLSGKFPCIGAKASITKGKYQFVLLDQMATEKSTVLLYQSLKAFAGMRTTIDKRFASFIACFTKKGFLTAEKFEILLWNQLKMLHDIDESDWDREVSSDINNPCFSYSIAGQAYFVIGMCPDHPRECRKFPYPILIFNSHHQFKYLKKIDLFYKIQKAVRLKEMEYNGSINPNLINVGEHSEALQYSGLKAEAGWKCPVHFDKKGS
ncbi:guanitoxin biosynthesis heme-dependent pre-guanitoxin N-hydroxylase GntA [Legionella spiritensis]|uniref:YqcI/YcgG family protein n=1 Tax=Legionella spiritensis TaxID=452 RepID=A0A0W0Z5B4_LEGSP|nr:guanitoxin biosynthesis heme-dependent pre-guanitoxin N-hydroxylase GntA [Legionella spiritensis]KTD64301.1 YqcI/YcgG family protein [Legionella spiritensis]SNV46779.1 Uncharacterized conserved protein [Legionella spiritensis]